MQIFSLSPQWNGEKVALQIVPVENGEEMTAAEFQIWPWNLVMNS